MDIAQLMPLPLAVSCFSKIQIAFTFLVLAYPVSPGKGPLNVCVFVVNITYSFIANCQTAVVRKNKTKRRSKTYKRQYILWYNILTVKLQSVI